MALTEEDVFVTLLTEKNHAAVIKLLGKILIKMGAESPPTKAIELLLRNIAGKMEDTSVPTAIRAISIEIVRKLDEIKEAYVPRPTSWKFDVHYKGNKVDYVSVRGI